MWLFKPSFPFHWFKVFSLFDFYPNLNDSEIKVDYCIGVSHLNDIIKISFVFCEYMSLKRYCTKVFSITSFSPKKMYFKRCTIPFCWGWS